jgi:hypothetical protein
MLKRILCSAVKIFGTIVPPEAFIRPTGVSLSGDRVYVIDAHAHAVFVFQKGWRFLFKFGEMVQERRIQLSHAHIHRKITFYITDPMNFRAGIRQRWNIHFCLWKTRRRVRGLVKTQRRGSRFRWPYLCCGC